VPIFLHKLSKSSFFVFSVVPPNAVLLTQQQKSTKFVFMTFYIGMMDGNHSDVLNTTFHTKKEGEASHSTQNE
jgi:hypothetical protein